MNIFGREIKLVIFDMDGTLIDSTGIWHQIDKDFFAKRGINKVPNDYAKEIVHMGLTKGAEMTINKYGFVNDTVEGIIKEWKDASFLAYKEKIQLKPFAIELLTYLKNNDVKLALATANDKELYDVCLKRLNVESYFDLITDVNLIKEGKSSPKIYESISNHFKVSKNETMVLEDTLVGLSTAFKAGFVAVGVDDLATRDIEEAKKENSTFYIYSLQELIGTKNGHDIKQK